MASHGRKRHLKRLAKPSVIPVPSKGSVYMVKTSAGKHAKKQAAPILVVLRDILKKVSNSKEAKKLLNSSEVFVDGTCIKDQAYNVGLMDIVSLPKIKANYRIINVKGKFAFQPISEAESKAKLCRINNKTIIPGGNVQLNLHDGRTVSITKAEDKFKTGDTIKLAVPKQKIESALKMEKGAKCYVFRGKHSGSIASLNEIKQREGSRATEAQLTHDKESFITLKDYLFVVDKDFKI